MCIRDRVYVLNEIGQGELVNQDLSDTKENNKVVKTQLDAVVRYIHEYYETQDVKEVKKPWLPPLPEQLVSPQELIRACLLYTSGIKTLSISFKKTGKIYR